MNELNTLKLEKCPEEVEAEIASELVTINDVVRYATSYLIENEVFLGHGTDSYWDEAMYLVMCTINLDPPADPDTLNARLTMREKKNIAKVLTKRVKDRVPSAYLTNRAWFSDIEFYVDERVLIPRSPIGEMIKNKFQPFLTKQPTRILDLCTGCGCIALACANAFRDCDDLMIDAVDISDDALDVCATNIYKYGVEDFVFPIKSDIFDGLPTDEKYDFIVCNPPYVDTADLEDMPEEFCKEPKLALEAGEDGLDLVKVILAEAKDHLTEDGFIVIEVGNSQLALQMQFSEIPFHWVEFNNGGSGVFVLTYNELVEYSEYFDEFRRNK